MHRNIPALLVRLLHQLEGQLSAPNGRNIPLSIDVHVFSFVIPDIVVVQMQLCTVHEIHACCQNLILFLHKCFKIFGCHGRFNPDIFDIFLCCRNRFDYLIGSIACPQIEPQLIQTCLT